MMCYSCKADKKESEFYKTSDMCKECKKQYNKNYYIRTKNRHNPSRFARTAFMRNIAQTFVIEYLKLNPCVDCGETDLVVLEFDHQRDKLFNIAYMVCAGMSVNKISEEIKKCQVVCANCHKRRTAKNFSWYKLTSSGE